MKTDVSTLQGKNGFTMIEMLVVLLVMVVLLALSAPSFRTASLNAQQRSTLEHLQSAMRLAQSVADRDRRTVTLCASDDGQQCSGSEQWERGWIVRSADPQNPNQLVVRAVVGQLSDSLAVRAAGFANASAIDFTHIGAAVSGRNAGTFTVCDARGAESAQALILMPNGQFHLATDLDLDGRVNAHDGGNIAC